MSLRFPMKNWFFGLKGGADVPDLPDFAKIAYIDRSRQYKVATSFCFLKMFDWGSRPGVKVGKMDPTLEGCHRRPVRDIDIIPTPVDTPTPQVQILYTSLGWNIKILGSKSRKTKFVYFSNISTLSMGHFFSFPEILNWIKSCGIWLSTTLQKSEMRKTHASFRRGRKTNISHT